MSSSTDAERRRAELAERVAEVHAALALALEAEPVAHPQRGVDRVRAHAVLPAPAPQLLAGSPNSVRSCPFGSRSA